MIPDAALDADIAILAKKGSGKTYTARGIVERLLAMERRVLILDPLSSWWGLKSSADGESPGFPIAVFGGPHGGMPLTEAMAEPLGEIIARENLPAVIDMGGLTKAASMRIVKVLLATLYAKNRDPLTIVLEEADEFAPQQPREGDSQAVFSEVDRIARRGRAFGFRLISITQRPARLHKDVLTQLSTLVAMRISSPQDRDAIKAWVEGNADRDKAREVMDSLATLETGEGWVWAPDFNILERTKFPKITTLDTSATPKAGERRIVPKALAEIDLTVLRAALEVPLATEKPKGSASLSADAIARAADEGRRLGRNEGYATGLVDGERAGRAKERARIMVRFQEAMKIEGDDGPATPSTKSEPAKPRESRKPAAAVNGFTLPSGAARMLEVLDTSPPIRMSWSAVAASIGNKARGGHFNSMRKSLVNGGHVTEEGGLVRIAQPSADAMPPMPPEVLAQVLRERWGQILGGRPRQIIGLLSSGPSSKAEIAVALNCAPTGGHWNAAWKSLRDNGLIEDRGGIVRLAGELAADMESAQGNAT